MKKIYIIKIKKLTLQRFAKYGTQFIQSYRLACYPLFDINNANRMYYTSIANNGGEIQLSPDWVTGFSDHQEKALVV